MGIRNNRYDAMVPVVVGPLRLKGRVHQREAVLLRSHSKRKIKLTLPGPMTIVDTIADRHYGDKVKLAMAFAGLLNQEARALEKDGVDVIQFDEPAFNVYMDDVKSWGIDALHRAIDGVKCTTCVHICYGYGIQANVDWKKTLGESWRQYEKIFPALAKSRIDQVSLECIHSKVPIELLRLLKGKDVLVGVIDVAADAVETPQEVSEVIGKALKYVPARHLFPCTNCGMAPMDREVAVQKLHALAAGARSRQRWRRASVPSAGAPAAWAECAQARLALEPALQPLADRQGERRAATPEPEVEHPHAVVAAGRLDEHAAQPRKPRNAPTWWSMKVMPSSVGSRFAP
jgi:5-methyltetrahydropteroyltriglutamate--homocysteine methyltransferase